MSAARFSAASAAGLLLLALAAARADGGPARTAALDPRALPLGDGKVAAEPRRGYVDSCRTRFRGGGARHAGDWIHGDTWDSTAKTQVQGDVAWPDAAFSVRTDGGVRRLKGNGLPVGRTTGVFPVRPDDPAFQIDRNPNSIEEQDVDLALPANPALARKPSCVPMGMIGVALNGVALFNALDDGGRDAVAHEVQDHCNGHPQQQGVYHYHGPSPCIPGASGRNKLLGYALDGFGIYSMHDAGGRELTNADLDECHGRTSPILWDGREANMYHYVMTREYPYTVGCFRGAPARVGTDAPPDGGPPDEREGGPRRPPPEAVDACAGSSLGAPCRFVSPRGDEIVGSCRSPAGELACVPRRP